MNVRYLLPYDHRLKEVHPLTGIREQPMLGTEIVPRAGETVLFIRPDGVEIEYQVKHLVHVIEQGVGISVQVVLK